MMKFKTYLTFVLTLLFSASFHVAAQLDYSGRIAVSGEKVTKTETATSVHLNFNFENLDIDNNHLLVVTPVISALSGSESVELPPVVVMGKRRSFILNRPFNWKGKPVIDTQADYQLVGRKAENLTVNYNETVPYAKWHQHARLWLKTEASGCAECDLGKSELPLMARIFADVHKPVYTMSFITPEAEVVKQRSESYTANFTYRVGKSELLPNFENNASELDKVDKVVREVQGDKDLTFTDIEINGYASPEGSYNSNMTLSQNRANAFFDYLVKKYGIAKEQVKVNWHGEDWSGLKIAVEKSDLDKKSEILAVIEDESNPDARDAKLVAIDNRHTYSLLLNELYPPLRRNDYTVRFIARAFNVEEAKQMLKTRPSLLSLNEMFLVAQTYEKRSAGYKEVFEVAARLFPDDPVSSINAAAVDLEAGNADAAYKRLEKLKDQPQAWNNLAVAMAMGGMYQEAETLFARAAAQGDEAAKANAAELRKMLETR